MPAANYEPEMRIDKLANRVEELERDNRRLREALEFCHRVLSDLPSSSVKKTRTYDAWLKARQALKGE